VAERALNDILKTRPDAAQVHAVLALSYFFRGRLVMSATASEAGARLARDREGNVAMMVRLADRSWREKSKRDVLLPRWQRLRSAHPKNPLLELIFLVSTRFMHESQALLDAIGAVQKRFPEHPAFTVLKLKTLFESGQYQAWLKAAHLAHLRFPASTSCLLEVAKAELRSGRLKGAEQKLKLALDQDGSLTEARILLAGLHARTGNESERMKQVMIGLSDAAPPVEQLAFLKAHGIALALLGRLREAEKLWTFCLKQAEKSGHSHDALACARAALGAHFWVAPVEKWKKWTTRMESILAKPSLEADIRQVHSLGLMWFKAVVSTRSGDLPAARAILTSLKALENGTTGLDAAEFYGRALSFEIGIRTKNSKAVKRALADLEKAQETPGRHPTCVLRFQRAVAARRFGNLAVVDSELSAILKQDCRPNASYDYLVAATQLKLAGVRLGQSKFEEAAALLSQFKQRWPKADPELTLVKNADELAGLLPE